MFYINPMNVSCYDFDWVHVIALNEFAYVYEQTIGRSGGERLGYVDSGKRTSTFRFLVLSLWKSAVSAIYEIIKER